jgi:SAM-dependent methyltransferase
MDRNVSEAAERNKEPILRILRTAFADSQRVLEIGSGTGQHATYFAAALPKLRWQPSDLGEHLSELARCIEQAALPNLSPLIELDVRQRPWPVDSCDAVYTANTLHIMSWSAVRDFFAGLEPVLQRPGVLCIYGPFRYGGDYTTDSNAAFDAYLRARDPLSGIRDFEAIEELAAAAGLTLAADHAMPANNQLLVWHKKSLAPAAARRVP